MPRLPQAALAKAWGRGFSLDNLTLHNFHYLLFEHETAAQSVINSFTYAAAAACIAMVLALSIAYIVSRRLLPLGRHLEFRRHGAVRGAGHRAGDRASTPPMRRRRWRSTAPRRS